MDYKSNIWKMYLFRLFRTMHFFGGVLIPFFMDWGGLKFHQIMLLQSFFMFCAVILEIPSGAIADFLGRKTSLVLAAISQIIGVIIYSTYPNFYIFMLGEFFWALSHALISGSSEALVYDTLKITKKEKQSKKIFARLSSFEIAGIMISAPIGSIIATYLGLRYSMMLIAIPLFIAILIALSFKEPPFKQKHDKYLDIIKSGINHVKKHKIIQILAFDVISITSLTFYIIWTYQPLLQQLNFPLLYFGFVHALMSGVQIIIMNNFGFLENVFGSKKNYVFASALITGVGFILLSFNTNIYFVITLIAVISGFGLSRRVIFFSYFNS